MSTMPNCPPGMRTRMVEGDHDIDCKIDGIGSMGLKSEFVKKA